MRMTSAGPRPNSSIDRREGVAEGGQALLVRVALGEQYAVLERHGAGDEHPVPGRDRAGEAESFLPGVVALHTPHGRGFGHRDTASNASSKVNALA